MHDLTLDVDRHVALEALEDSTSELCKLSIHIWMEERIYWEYRLAINAEGRRDVNFKNLP